jgi:hypothetical protein
MFGERGKEMLLPLLSIAAVDGKTSITMGMDPIT